MTSTSEGPEGAGSSAPVGGAASGDAPDGWQELPKPRFLTARWTRQDRIYRLLVTSVAVGAFALLFAIGLFLFLKSLPTYKHESFWTFLTTTSFNTTGHQVFGVAAALYWTVVIALIAVVVGVPIALAAALFITEYAPRRLRRALITLIDLLAVVPSVIFGLWGFFVLEPNVTGFAHFLSAHLGFIPIFHTSSTTLAGGASNLEGSAFIAGIVVGLMIVPIVTSIAREIFSLAPIGEREGALALGATKAGVIRAVVWPFGRGGFVGATMLGLGRALGETIAVAIVISLTFQVSPELLKTGANSIAALIAIQFGTGGALKLAALLAAGFVLFCVTLVINLGASVIVNRSRTGASA